MPRRAAFPTAWVNIYLLLEDFGQAGADELIELSGPPIDFEVEVNAFVEADVAKVTVDLENFPFDPRILRGGTVEVFFADAGKPVQAQDFWLAKAPDELRALALFAGVIDVPKSIFDNEHRRIELKCRDYTAYFLDAEVEGDAITFVEGNRKLSLKEILESLVAQRETTAAIQIEFRDDIPDVYPADYKRRGNDPKLGARRKRHAERVWDVVQELVLEAGLVAYVELDRLVVRQPSTIFSPETDEARLLRWTIGGDVLKVEVTRDLGRQHGINVQVTSFDPDEKRTLVAYSPIEAADEPKEEANASRVGDGKRKIRKTTRTTFRPFAVRGIVNQEQLQRIADEIREQLRHHELRVEWETASVVESQGKPLQRIAYGDPVEFAIVEHLHSVLAKTPEEQVRRLIGANYQESDAEKIALALEHLGVPLYLHRARHRFSTRQGQGYTLELEARSRKTVDLGGDRAVKKELAIEIGPVEE